MNHCTNCNALEFLPASYGASGDGTQLPARICCGCGCLELDEERMDEIVATLRAPELRVLHGAPLRHRVLHLLEARSERASYTDSGVWSKKRPTMRAAAG